MPARSTTASKPRSKAAATKQTKSTAQATATPVQAAAPAVQATAPVAPEPVVDESVLFPVAAESTAAQDAPKKSKRGRPRKSATTEQVSDAVASAPAKVEKERVLPRASEIRTVSVHRKVRPSDLTDDIDVLRSNLELLEKLVLEGHLSSTSGMSVARRVFRYANKNLDKLEKNVGNVKTSRRSSGGNKGPSGLGIQYNVSVELAEFMDLSAGETASRADAGRAFCKYVKANGLQDADQKRIIHPDAKLKKILDYDPATDGPITFSTYTKYIQHHFFEPAATQPTA